MTENAETYSVGVIVKMRTQMLRRRKKWPLDDCGPYSRIDKIVVSQKDNETEMENKLQVEEVKVEDSDSDDASKGPPEKCDICDGTFTDLITHIRTHFYEKPFLCTRCNLSFKIKEELSFHKKSCYQPPKKSANCSACATGMCNNQDHLKSSQSTAHTNKSYKCAGCNKYFGQYNQWKIHTHYCSSQSKFHKCENCQKCFTFLSTFKIHRMKCEKKEMKDLSCDFCDVEFSEQLDLIVHTFKTHNKR